MTGPELSVPTAAPPPWWRVGFVWLVFGGPLAVVAASLVTAVIAVSGAEEVLTETSNSPSATAKGGTAMTDPATLPAMQGRNHAASPQR